MKYWLVAAPVCLVMVLASSSVAFAHKPTFGDQGYDSPENAYVLADPSVSIVFYRPVTCETPQLWMTFEASAGFPLFVQLLIPRIERLLDYRPAVAVVGPGLPAADPGIRLPDGSGALVFRTEDAQPRAFDESFTMTQDLILVEQTIMLPESGRYYIVAWDPAGRTGKLDLAVGTVEQFGVAEIGMAAEWTRLTRTFHETADYPPAGDVQEKVCAMGKSGPAADEDAGTSMPAGNPSQKPPPPDGEDAGMMPSTSSGMATPARDGGVQPPIRGAGPSGAGSPSTEAPRTTRGDAGVPEAQAGSSAMRNDVSAPKSAAGGCSVGLLAGQESNGSWFALSVLAFLRLRRARRRISTDGRVFLRREDCKLSTRRCRSSPPSC